MITEGVGPSGAAHERASDESTVEFTTEIRGRAVSCRWSPSGVSGDAELLARIARSAVDADWERSAAALVCAMRAAVPGAIHARVREGRSLAPADDERGEAARGRLTDLALT